jgi:DDE superfamily endonuclease
MHNHRKLGRELELFDTDPLVGAGLPYWLPAGAAVRHALAADVSNWLRPGAATSPDRLFCHVYGRGKGQAQMIPGWPYSVIAALEPGRTSWTGGGPRGAHLRRRSRGKQRRFIRKALPTVLVVGPAWQ